MIKLDLNARAACAAAYPAPFGAPEKRFAGERRMKMDQELIRAIKCVGAEVIISLYPPTMKIIDEIVSFLKDNDIPFSDI